MSLATQLSYYDLYYFCSLEFGYGATGTSSYFDSAEVNQYMHEWEEEVLADLEYCWGSSSLAIGTSTFVQTALSTDLGRLATVAWCPGGTDTSTYDLIPRAEEDLYLLDPNWRTAAAGNPKVIYPLGYGTWGLWPTPAGTGTLYAEFPVKSPTTYVGTNTGPLPPWTRYGVVPYVAYRLLSRTGPLQDLPRAAAYKNLHDHNKQVWRTMKDKQFPAQGLRLRPGGRTQSHILNPRGRL